MEFLELKQGNTTVAEYAAKFKHLVRYFPHYQGEDGERSKCLKFINGLRPEIKMMVNYHSVHEFAHLVNMCRVFDEDQREKNTFYRNTGPSRDKRQMPLGYGRPFPAPSGRFGGQSSSQRIGGSQSAPKGSQAPVQSSSFSAGRGPQRSYGKSSASATVAPPTPVRCGKCGRVGHTTMECRDAEVTCFNCQGKGHLSMDCPRPRKSASSSSQSG